MFSHVQMFDHPHSFPYFASPSLQLPTTPLGCGLRLEFAFILAATAAAAILVVDVVVVAVQVTNLFNFIAITLKIEVASGCRGFSVELLQLFDHLETVSYRGSGTAVTGPISQPFQPSFSRSSYVPSTTPLPNLRCAFASLSLSIFTFSVILFVFVAFSCALPVIFVVRLCRHVDFFLIEVLYKY